jgi:hypothetical protein
VGRVLTAELGTSQACTASLIGRRHILMASSCAIWHDYTDDSPPAPIIFQPAYNLGIIYPTAHVIHALWKKKVSPDAWQTTNEADWLVGILNRDVSATSGYFGTGQYSSTRNGLSVWDMTSYPSDINWYSEAQVTQGPMAINSVVGEGSPSELYIMDGVVAVAGDFGAPVYFLDNTTYRLIGIVGVQDWRKPQVWAQGGSALLNLITQALEDFP